MSVSIANPRKVSLRHTAANRHTVIYSRLLGAVLAGAIIEVISPIAGLLATAAIISAVEKVNEYIISPIVECFSSKEKEV